MKKILAVLLVLTMLLHSGCGSMPAGNPTETRTDSSKPNLSGETVEIILDGQTVTVNGEAAGDGGTAVYISQDIVYYEEKTTYESGNPYGEGSEADMHTAEEAANHLVVNITQPGNYRLSGKLDLGQIRIDLGEDAYDDPNAVVNLILDGVDITCTVGPAIVFQNVYECDGDWSADTAGAEVDTTAAGANLLLAEDSENIVRGSYVAKIFKDKEGEKKLWKQDGAIYSYMSMNVFGPGCLDLYAENEGLDTELHLTIYGGEINIRSGNDGINTNEDGVSVTTINGGVVHIIAGLGEEGDGIDSNGYLVINGGVVMAFANPAADAGLDSDLGSYINGGTVIALGSAMDWAESDSSQVTMNLQFAGQQEAGSAIVITRNGDEVFCYYPAQDENLGDDTRSFRGAIISCPDFRVGDSYQVFVGGQQMAYTGTDVMGHGPGGFGGMGPGGGVTPPGDMPQPPESDFTVPGKPGEQPGIPAGDPPTMPEGGMPGGMGSRPGQQGSSAGEPNILFYMQDKVNFFSGLRAYAAE